MTAANKILVRIRIREQIYLLIDHLTQDGLISYVDEIEKNFIARKIQDIFSENIRLSVPLTKFTNHVDMYKELSFL